MTHTADIDPGPYARPCPRCGAEPGEPCWNLRTHDANAWPHRARVIPPVVVCPHDPVCRRLDNGWPACSVTPPDVGDR